jgi:bifunctional DNA-binding transcriptional regulator/antitoxin component of YhaV-PrlF toxin-antitoxin module
MAEYHIVWSAKIALSPILMDKIVANSRVQPGFRITLTKDIRRKLKTKVGDIVAFVEDERGNIIIKKAELKTV